MMMCMETAVEPREAEAAGTLAKPEIIEEIRAFHYRLLGNVAFEEAKSMAEQSVADMPHSLLNYSLLARVGLAKDFLVSIPEGFYTDIVAIVQREQVGEAVEERASAHLSRQLAWDSPRITAAFEHIRGELNADFLGQLSRLAGNETFARILKRLNLKDAATAKGIIHAVFESEAGLEHARDQITGAYEEYFKQPELMARDLEAWMKVIESEDSPAAQDQRAATSD